MKCSNEGDFNNEEVWGVHSAMSLFRGKRLSEHPCFWKEGNEKTGEIQAVCKHSLQLCWGISFLKVHFPLGPVTGPSHEDFSSDLQQSLLFLSWFPANFAPQPTEVKVASVMESTSGFVMYKNILELLALFECFRNPTNPLQFSASPTWWGKDFI